MFYFSSFIAKLWHNYLEGISKGKSSLCATHPHLLVIIVAGGIINVGEIRINLHKKNIHLAVTSTEFRPFCFDGTQTFLWLFVFLNTSQN